ERLLFLAWVQAARGRYSEATAYLQQAEQCRYPPRALRVWQHLVPSQPETAVPPDGVRPPDWFLHRAAVAIGQEHPAEALAWIKRAGDTASDCVRTAIPELQQLVRAEALARVGQFADTQRAITPSLLIGTVACLERESDGRALLDAA